MNIKENIKNSPKQEKINTPAQNSSLMSSGMFSTLANLFSQYKGGFSPGQVNFYLTCQGALEDGGG